MIETREQLFNSKAVVSLVSLKLAGEIWDKTQNSKLEKLINSSKGKVLIPKELREQLKKQWGRPSRKGVGGRPAIPVPKNWQNLPTEERKRIYNRIKKRESRAKNGI